MAEIITAENCGFCAGVKKAVDTLLGEIALSEKNNARVYLLGKIIHNDSFIEELAKKGVTVIGDGDINTFDGFEENAAVVIRAHGVPKPVLARLEGLRRRKNIKIVDATCECVKRMRKIAEENTNGETLALIFGDKDHPEIVGLASCVNGESVIYRDFKNLKLSTLGYGAMRLPMDKKSDKVDEKEAKKHIEYAYKNDVNFFDCPQTAKSETAKPHTAKSRV